MIFDKILKTNDLDFEIVLNKQEYRGDEIVKGTLRIIAKRDCKIRGLRLSAEGIEKTVIERVISSSSHDSSKTESQSNIFFAQDLSTVLNHLNMNGIKNKDKTTVVINKGTEIIHFEFSIPSDAFPSYDGANAKIFYQIKATADRDNWIDKNKTLLFLVSNSNHRSSPRENYEMYSNPQSEINIFNEDQLIAKEDPEKLITDGAMGEKIKSTDQNNFSKVNDNFHKHRQKYSKQDPGITIEFIGKEKDGSYDDSRKMVKNKNRISYYPGQEIIGSIIIDGNLLKDETSNMEISLRGIEYSYANGVDAIIEAEEYQIKNISFDMEKLKSVSHMAPISYSNNNNNRNKENGLNIKYVIPFETKLPHIANKSYVGKYSEFFWGFDAKINIPFSQDIHAKAIIEIV
ncbi:vacuolar protein sorting-associated family 26 protein [Candidatus Nitrosocosmicus sp. T]